MKTAIRLLLSGLILGGCSVQAASLSITVSPTAITNNYVGPITLSISNLSSAGATIRVDRVLDVNSNGVIDSSEPLTQSFYVTDGQWTAFGGIRNSNVPGDFDAAANQTIKTLVPYPNPNLTVDHIAGQYIYRVTDLGNQATATTLLEVSQQVLPQGFNGQVMTSGGTPLADAPVVASQSAGNNGFGAVTDSNGRFTIYAVPGAYNLLTVYGGQIGNAATSYSLNSNAFQTANLTNLSTDGTTISGFVTDSVQTNVGLPSVTIECSTTNGLALYQFTGTNGAYSFLATSNKWKLKLSGGNGVVLGYCVGTDTSASANTTGGSVSNVNFQMIKGNALVYGTVAVQSSPIPQIEMDADNNATNNNAFEGRGLTDSNGNYWVAIVAGGDAVEPDTSGLTGYSAPNVAIFNVAGGQAIQENFVLQPITASLSGIVQDNFGDPIANINMYVDPTNDPTGALDQEFQSASNGTFTEGVSAGVWNLALECNAANASNLISPTLTISVTNGANISNLVVVAQRATGAISGTVKDSSGNPLVGVNMYGNAALGTNYYVSGCVETDSNGYYSLLAFSGQWTVGGNYPGMTNEDVTVSGSNATLDFVVPVQSIAPILGSPAWSGGQFSFMVTGSSNQSYCIEASTNLLPNGWVPIYTNSGNFFFSTNPGASYKELFFRAVAIP